MRIPEAMVEYKDTGSEPPLTELERLREAMAVFTATARDLERTHDTLRARVSELTSEAALLRDRLQKVLAGISDGVVACDSRLTVTTANAAAQALGILEGAPATAALAPLLRLALDGRQIANQEVQAPLASGRALVLSVSAGPLVDEGDGVQGAVATFRDITELRKLQADLARKERLAALGQMAAAVAHEVRNPLGGIRLYLELVGRALDRSDVAAAAGAVRAAEDGVRRIDATIEDVLTFARDMKARVQPLLLRPLADTVIAAFAMGAPPCAPANGPGGGITNTVPSDLVVEADAGLVERALANLLQNALEAGAATVEVTAQTCEDGVRVCVLDDGPGLSPEAAARAFEPFFTSRAEGTGLGLAIVERIAAAHGGSAFIRNRPTAGVEAGIVIPARPAAEQGTRGRGDKKTRGQGNREIR